MSAVVFSKIGKMTSLNIAIVDLTIKFVDMQECVQGIEWLQD